MKAKHIWFFSCVIGCSWLAYHQFSETDADTIHPLNKTAHKLGNVLIQQTNSSINEQPKENQPLSTSEVVESPLHQEILAEISQRLFSDDPYVELLSMELLFDQCYDVSALVELINEKPHPKQQELAQLIKQKCQKINAQYPVLLENLNNKHYRKLFEPNSQLGRALKSAGSDQLNPFERKENAKQILLLSLKEGNSAYMTISGLMHMWGNEMSLPLDQIINSHNNIYINKISSIALNRLSCEYQQGMVCQPADSLMLNSCLQNPLACGMDYETWYQNNTLPGMKRDTEKLMTYYRQFMTEN